MRRPIIASVLLVLATPALAQPPDPPRSDSGMWIQERAASLEASLEGLKDRVSELADRAKPAAEHARKRFEAERPQLEAAGQSLWEKTKTFVARVRDEVRGFLDRSETSV
jgi:hypothetical protein